MLLVCSWRILAEMKVPPRVSRNTLFLKPRDPHLHYVLYTWNFLNHYLCGTLCGSLLGGKLRVNWVPVFPLEALWLWAHCFPRNDVLWDFEVICSDLDCSLVKLLSSLLITAPMSVCLFDVLSVVFRWESWQEQHRHRPKKSILELVPGAEEFRRSPQISILLDKLYPRSPF